MVSRVIVLLLELLVAAIVNSSQMVMIEDFPGEDINFVCSSQPTKWCFKEDGQDTIPLPSNLISGSVATILNLAGTHEGVYTCFDGSATLKSFNLTVLALAKFINCPQITKTCNLDTLYTFEEGRQIVFNVSLDFYGGGNRNEKQKINYIFLRNPMGTIFVSCLEGTNCIAQNENRFGFTMLEQYTIQMYVNNSLVIDSGVYKAEAEVSEGTNIVDTITSIFTINVTSTVPIPSSSSSSPVVMTTSSTLMTTQQTTITTTSKNVLPPSTAVVTMTTMTSSDDISTSSSSMSSSSTAQTSSSTTTTVTATPDVGGINDRTQPLNSGYVALIAVIGLIIIIIMIISMITGIYILSKKNGHTRASFTFKRISIFRKDKFKVNSLPSTDATKNEIQIDSMSEGHYSSVYCSTTGAEIICTGAGVYAKVELSKNDDKHLSRTPNSSEFLV